MAKSKTKAQSKSSFEGPTQFEPLTTSAYLASLSIENVRCFGAEPQTLSLLDSTGCPAQWTVILGNNGTGKTTLLQCLTAMDPMLSLRQGQRLDPRGATFDLHLGRPFLRKSTNRDYWKLAIKLAVQTSLRKSPEATYFPNYWFGYHVRNLQFDCESPSANQERTLVPFARCFGYGASRRMGQQSLAEAPGLDSCATLFDETKELRNAQDWLLQVDYAASKESPNKQRFEQHRDHVIEILKGILPDVTDVRISAPQELQARPTIEFQTTMDGWIPLSGISYGYRSFFAWIVDFASRMLEQYPKSKDPLAEPAIVLVDEIDLHLHPTWQRKLMTYLSDRFPNTQFIVTAHSPVFVQAAADANIVLLRRDDEKGHVVIENSPHVIRNWRIDQLLTSELFGLTSSRPPNIEPLLEERRKLQTKRKQTKRDLERLRELEQQIGPLPTGDSVADVERAGRLDRTLDLLEKKLGVRA